MSIGSIITIATFSLLLVGPLIGGLITYLDTKKKLRAYSRPLPPPRPYREMHLDPHVAESLDLLANIDREIRRRNYFLPTLTLPQYCSICGKLGGKCEHLRDSSDQPAVPSKSRYDILTEGVPNG